MKKILFFLILLVFIFASRSAYSFSFGSFINNIKKAVTPKANSAVQNKGNSSTAVNTATVSNVASSNPQSDSCSQMFMRSPKMAIAKDIANKALIGAGAGAAAGALLYKKNRVAGAMIGGILGLIGGSLVGSFQHFYELHKSYSTVAEYLNYNPNNGPYFKIANVRTGGTAYSIGQYIYVDIRYDILTRNKNNAQLISYYGSLYRNKIHVNNFYDRIELPEGEVSDIFDIPVCEGAIKGNYILKLKIICNGIVRNKNIKFAIK